MLVANPAQLLTRLLRIDTQMLFWSIRNHWVLEIISGKYIQKEGSQPLISIDTYFSLGFNFLKILFIYSWETQRQRQAEGEAGSLWAARYKNQSQDPRITTWANSRGSITEPPRCPHKEEIKHRKIFLPMDHLVIQLFFLLFPIKASQFYYPTIVYFCWYWTYWYLISCQTDTYSYKCIKAIKIYGHR